MKQRHTFVDALRGFALFGIMIVNIEFIIQSADIGFAQFTSGTDRTVRWLIVALGQTKIYPLFALLFGYGLSVQIERARSDEAALRPRYRRRMIGLVLLGILHGVLFFPGDILVIYAAVGALAYRFGRYDSRRLLKMAGWTYGVATIFWLVVGFLDLDTSPAAPSTPADVLEVLTRGSFIDVIGNHAGYWIVTLLILTAVQGPAVFACFLVGIVLGRTQILADPATHTAYARRAIRWIPLGLVGAAIGATMTVAGGRWDTLGFAVGFAAAPFMAAGYLGLLARSIGTSSGMVSRTLQASGRMSLTVYLLESVIASTLAYGYGFGLFGDTDPLAAAGVATAIWLALSAFAVVWMRNFRFGPFEWALRSFTYGQVQPLRKA